MLLYPQVFCNAGVLISACFNAESISFNVVVLLYVVKNADVCRLLHTVFMILHFTISEYHFLQITHHMSAVVTPCSKSLNLGNLFYFLKSAHNVEILHLLL